MKNQTVKSPNGNVTLTKFEYTVYEILKKSETLEDTYCHRMRHMGDSMGNKRMRIKKENNQQPTNNKGGSSLPTLTTNNQRKQQ